MDARVDECEHRRATAEVAGFDRLDRVPSGYVRVINGDQMVLERPLLSHTQTERGKGQEGRGMKR